MNANCLKICQHNFKLAVSWPGKRNFLESRCLNSGLATKLFFDAFFDDTLWWYLLKIFFDKIFWSNFNSAGLQGKPPMIEYRKNCSNGKIGFGFSEKHTKICTSFAHFLSKHPNHEDDFFKFCVLLRKSELFPRKVILMAFPTLLSLLKLQRMTTKPSLHTKRSWHQYLLQPQTQ